LIVEAASSEDWASVTFVGARHTLALRLEGETGAVAVACARLAGRLGDHDIPVAGQIVPDIAVALSSFENRDGNLVTQMLTINLLTIID
jgi:hypothetical protein